MRNGSRNNIAQYPADLSVLTSFRFFAAMFVVLFHLRVSLPLNIDEYTHLFAKGYLAVDFFFILSGFILLHVYKKSFEEGYFDSLTFILKRFARVYPMHLVTLAFYVLLYFVATNLDVALNKPEKYDLTSIPANLLMVHAWGFTDKLTFNYPSWSVSAEWFAYLLFPFMAPVLVRWRAPTLLFLSIVVYVAIWLLAQSALGLGLTQLTYQLAFLHIFPEFLFGIAIYLSTTSINIPKQRVWPLFLGILALILVSLHFNLSDFMIIPLFGILILLGAELSRTKNAVMLKNPALVYLGEISYSIYMVHAAVFTVVLNGMKLVFNQAVPAPLAWSIPLMIPIIVVLIAAFTYHFIEVPCRVYITRIGHKMLLRRSQDDSTS